MKQLFTLFILLTTATICLGQDSHEELSKIKETLKANYPAAFENFTIYSAGKLLEEQPKESEKLIREVLDINPNSTESHHLLSKIKLAENNTTMADSLINMAIELAGAQKERQWKINEMIETRDKINSRE